MSQMKAFAQISILLVCWTVRLPCSVRAASASVGVQITQLEDRLRIEINGQLFSEYHFKEGFRPYFYPVLGPGSVPMTRDFPMKDSPNESHDHPHHRSLWFAHGSINGRDFWDIGLKTGKTIHEEFDEIKSGKNLGVIKSHDKWVGADGVVVCTDERTIRIYNPPYPNERLFDFDITLKASNGDLTFGDTKEGTMAVRVAESMKLKHPGEH